ncbi:hypothetical protein [Salinisphaera sp.]|uniref:hypothetical protein n=1 Tax=Salinisphaera sp. TaxID=1914330 RepID=UPI000C396AD3|nr:hypothetical protein [Salinisphaera sp.]MAS09948.1 hypothetical protein [Salinisphaera sp.]
MTEAQRDKNRERFPETAALKDKFEALGFDVKVLYASENGHIVGREPDWFDDCAIKPKTAIKATGESE